MLMDSLGWALTIIFEFRDLTWSFIFHHYFDINLSCIFFFVSSLFLFLLSFSFSFSSFILILFSFFVSCLELASGGRNRSAARWPIHCRVRSNLSSPSGVHRLLLRLLQVVSRSSLHWMKATRPSTRYMWMSSELSNFVLLTTRIRSVRKIIIIKKPFMTRIEF